MRFVAFALGLVRGGACCCVLLRVVACLLLFFGFKLPFQESSPLSQVMTTAAMAGFRSLRDAERRTVDSVECRACLICALSLDFQRLSLEGITLLSS